MLANRLIDRRLICIVALLSGWPLASVQPLWAVPPSRNDVIALMAPYLGRSAGGINREKLDGKILCGYQGWFTTAGDAAGRGWRHYQLHGKFEPGFCAIE